MSINRKSMNKRWNPFQKYVLIGLVILGGIVLGLVLFMFLYSRYEVWAIKNPARFRHEVGYHLPDNTQIIYTEARVFSLADGPNYTWLVTSESSLRAWAEGRGIFAGPGPGGWSHIRSFYEVAPYDKNFQQLTLDSVWRVHVDSSYSYNDTTYIFLAGNHRVALIETFRP